MSNAETFEGWCVLEIMGHRRLAGWLSEQEIAGAAFLRIDIPVQKENSPDEWPNEAPDGTTQFYAPSAVYAITPTTKEIVLELAKSAPKPVQPWDLRSLLPKSPEVVAVPFYEDEGPGDDDLQHPF